MSFEGSRRQKKCYMCAGSCSCGQKCSAGAMRNHVRDLLRRGHSAVHIFSDLVQRMEGDLDQRDQSPPESQINYEESFTWSFLSQADTSAKKMPSLRP